MRASFNRTPFFPLGCALLFLFATRGVDAADLSEDVRLLKEQNRKLQEQLDDQRKLIDQLRSKVDSGGTGAPSGEEREREQAEGLLKKPFGKSNIILSGEAGLAFFHQGRKGQFPNSEFRVDEAKLFFDVKVWENVYLFSEINVVEREQPDEFFHLGELYVDFEGLSREWNEKWLNLRVGRFDTPFGEEYMTRDAIDNRLISHSLSDIWGVDEGIEIYGSFDKWKYVFAVQNGGVPTLYDANGDKAVIGRLSYAPWDWLYLSASGMRTGDLHSSEDKYSALWFGNGFFRALGTPATTPRFAAELVEGDVRFSFPRGYVTGAGGYVHASDLQPEKNQRDIYYYFVEGSWDLTPKLYSAARFSEIFARKGYPMVGAGDAGPRFYSPAAPYSEHLWRLSVGLGYRWTKDLITKIEYSFNGGRDVSGASRSHEDFFGIELTLRF